MSERPRIKATLAGGQYSETGRRTREKAREMAMAPTTRGPRPTASEAAAQTDPNSHSAQLGRSMGRAIGDIISNSTNMLGRNY